MLAGVLLHVITAALGVNQAADAASFWNRSGVVQNVEDGSVISLRDFGYAQLRSSGSGWENRPGIKNLAAAGGIESGAVENDCSSRVGVRSGDCVHDLSVEFV